MSGGGEHIYLVMADARYRAACFSALVGPAHRIVRSFASVSDFVAGIDDGGAPPRGGGMVIFADTAGRVAGLHQILLALAGRSDLAALIVTGKLDMASMLAVVRAGVVDVLPAPCAPSAVARRAEQLLPAVAAHQSARAAARAARTRLAQLTPREAEVLAAIAAGQSAKEIGRSLLLSPRTAEVHRANIMKRLGVGSLAALLKLYFLADLGEPPAFAIRQTARLAPVPPPSETISAAFGGTSAAA